MRRTLSRGQTVACLVIFLALIGVVGCRKKVAPPPPPPPPPAPTASISVSPSTIEEGASATLTWSSSNAKTATISGIGSVETSGSHRVTPTETTVYNFSVTGDGGAANSSATLAVTRVPMPTVGIRANPITIKSGESTTLSWTSNRADRVVIDSGVGQVEPTGSRTVRPTSTTRYTATATGRGGTSQNSVEVTVLPPPPPVEELFASNFRDIFFDYDKHNIRDDAQRTLQEDMRWSLQIEQERGVRVRFRIEGHCDERGTTKYNLALGDRRATATKNFLISLGLPADRILEVISYGEERPFAMGHDEEAWAQNRRTHFVLIP